MLRIGLTGGIGTGKSTASKILEELGAYVFDADKEAKKHLRKHSVLQKKLVNVFGKNILTGGISRELNTKTNNDLKNLDFLRSEL